VNQYNAFILAVTQESYDLNVHKSDFTQVEDYANAIIVHLSPYVADMGGLNSATEPQVHGVSVRLPFNLQHWSTIPFGRGRRLPIRDHGPPGEAVCKDSANASGNASSPDEAAEVIGGPLFQFIIGCWIPESTFLQYPGMHGERHSQTIEAKWTTSILRAAFSAK
jgi:hypothetical protein